MHCEACRNDLEPDAPIYRVSLSYNDRVIIRVCAACNARPPLFYPNPDYPDYRKWWPSSPCIHCGRPIIASRKWRPPKQ